MPRGRRVLVLAALLAAAALVVSGCATWMTYHRDNARSGSDPGTGGLAPARRIWTTPPLDGLVYAQPLVSGTRVYVATENNTVYALDLGTGRVVWARHLGTPVARSSLPCGNIDPLGITGTPAIDPGRNELFLVAELAAPRIHHDLFGIDLGNGGVRLHRSGDLWGFDPVPFQQRPALTVNGGRVYWEFGGLEGDCGNYHGAVLSTWTDGSHPLAYVVPAHRQAAIWAPAGASVDRNGNLWVATGNGDSSTTFDHGNSVITLSSTLRELAYFAPTNWARLNVTDLDLGSTGPAVLPGGYVLQVGKDGVVYLLRQAGPGGIGGQVASLPIGCGAYGGDSYIGTSPVVVYVPCLSGTRAVSVGPGPALRLLWSGPPDANGSPVVAGGAVWVVGVDSGVLYALNPLSGATVQRFTVGHARHFTSPAAGLDTLVVATDTSVQAFRHR